MKCPKCIIEMREETESDNPVTIQKCETCGFTIMIPNWRVIE